MGSSWGRWRRSHPEHPGWRLITHRTEHGLGYTYRIERRDGTVLSPSRGRHNASYRSRKDAATGGQAGCYYELEVVHE